MTPDASPVDGPKNNPMHPIAWLRVRDAGQPPPQRIFATTMGAAQDWSSEDLRRLFLNAAFWTLGMESQIPSEGLEAGLLGQWEPSAFGFQAFRRGLTPADYQDGTP